MKYLDQINAVFGNLKWIIVISLLISGLLFFPAQVRELYRISAAEDVLSGTAEFGSIVVIAFAIWFAATQLAAETLSSKAKLARGPDRILRCIPAVLGSLPLFAAAFAQFLSRPSLKKVSPEFLQVDSVFRIQNADLEGVGHTLVTYSWILIAIGLLTFATTSMLNAKALGLSEAANRKYFKRPLFLIATIGVLAGIIILFIWFPVSLPQALGTFGILAIFTVCLTAICVHLSLLSIVSIYHY